MNALTVAKRGDKPSKSPTLISNHVCGHPGRGSLASRWIFFSPETTDSMAGLKLSWSFLLAL